MDTDHPVVLAAPDKFRGTMRADQVADAIALGSAAAGRPARRMPIADGGEGFLDALAVLGGTKVITEVTGPDGAPVSATWLDVGDLCVIEMAQASGLTLAGGAAGNDPLAATSRGTGELMVAAAQAMAERSQAQGGPMSGVDGPGPAGTIVVGLGGSATTDGGLGALSAVEEFGGLGGVELIGACDVNVAFLEAARQFSRQKGADPAQSLELEARLRLVARRFEREFGVDVLATEGTGAAGGFGGMVVALGGRLRSGYDVVTELVGFRQALGQSRLVVTGEGALDATSFSGKVVGSVLGDAADEGVAAMVVAGRASAEAIDDARELGAHVVSLVDVFGEARALSDTAHCIEEAVADYVGSSEGI